MTERVRKREESTVPDNVSRGQMRLYERYPITDNNDTYGRLHNRTSYLLVIEQLTFVLQNVFMMRYFSVPHRILYGICDDIFTVTIRYIVIPYITATVALESTVFKRAVIVLMIR